MYNKNKTSNFEFNKETEGICYIVGSGVLCGHNDSLDNQSINFTALKNDIIIAVDGGYKYLIDSKLKPNYIIGDFDSLGSDVAGDNVIKLNVEKNETDILVSVNKGIELGFKVFKIYGGLGGSHRHILANVQVLKMLTDKGLRGYLINSTEVMAVAAKGTVSFDKNNQGMVSIFSLTDTATVTLSGLKYNLDNHTLNSSYPLGVSNEFVGIESSIEIHGGYVVIVTEKVENT